MGQPLNVLLDLDGTLIDPKPGILGSIQYALRQMGVEPPPAAELTWAIGPALRSTFGRLLGEDRAEAGVAHYRKFYADGAMYDAEVFQGIPAALELLRARGHRLFVVTAKPHVFARPIIERLGLGTCMTGLYGPELDGTHDDKADLLGHVLRSEGMLPDGAVMVGDRRFDLVAAHANGMRAIGVTWGYGTLDELNEAGADALCDAPTDLPATVEKIGLRLRGGGSDALQADSRSG